MDHLVGELEAAVEGWDGRGWPRPEALVVSGSGLASELGTPLIEPRSWKELLPFEARGIEGHPLDLHLLEPVPGRVVLYSRGRLHAYQGYTAAQTVFIVRLAALLGARVLVVTNSAGGLLESHRPGDLVLLSDHLNLSGKNPLEGVFPPAWGPQFPDMTAAYDPELRRLLHALAADLGIDLQDGVYAGVYGPSYETPAEVRMLRHLGADVVGMSTVLEVIAANHMGLRCAGLSLVSNPAAGVVPGPLDHADVLAQGKEAGVKVARLLRELVRHPQLFETPGSAMG